MQYLSFSGPTEFDPAPSNGSHGTQIEPIPVLVVEPLLTDALTIVSALSAEWYRVTVVETFGEAKAQLSSHPPALLITEIQLADFNGLHLVLHGKSIRPDLAAIVTARRSDPGLRLDAEQMGATFVLKPAAPSELVAAVIRTMLRQPNDTRAIIEPFERRIQVRRRVHHPEQVVIERRHGERRRRVPRFAEAR